MITGPPPAPGDEDNGGTDFSDPATFGVPATSQSTFTKDDDYWAPAASLVWSTTDSSSIYVSFSQGRTPGGLTMTPLRTVGFGIDPDHNGNSNEIAFNSERITSVEFGGSAAAVNDTLHFDVGLFVQRIGNRQVVTSISVKTSAIRRTRPITKIFWSILLPAKPMSTLLVSNWESVGSRTIIGTSRLNTPTSMLSTTPSACCRTMRTRSPQQATAQ